MIKGRDSHEKVVNDYVESVLSGSRVTGEYERHAVNRYLSDLDHATERGWYFDKRAANYSCDFFPDCCTHTLAEWADEAFHLSPWQTFAIWNVHGWRSSTEKYNVEWSDGRTVSIGSRRFRKAYLTVGRKNGKTTLLAGEANHLAFDDLPRERGGRGYCVATKLAQANLMWSEAQRMISQGVMAEECEITGEGSTTGVGCAIKVTGGPQHGTQFVPLGSDSRSQDGLNPSYVLKDEIHEWRNRHRKLNGKLNTGGASRRQPLEWIITTFGDDESEIWEEEHEFCCRVVEAGARGQVVDDTVFALIYTIDDKDDPLDEACWPKANPNIGTSCKLKYLRTQATEAREKPSSYDDFVRYNSNRRVGSRERAYPKELWDRGDLDFPEPEPGDLCFIGFDLGRTNDWAAWGAVFPQKFTDENGEDAWRYKLKHKAFCCKGTNVKTKYTEAPYSLWIKDGRLVFQGDEVIDTAELKQDLIDMCGTYNVKSIPYDDSFAGVLATDIYNNYGLPIFSFYQTHLRYNSPLIEFEKDLTKGRIDHGNCPVLNFQAGNCQYNYDNRKRRMLEKGALRRWKKIDSMVAIVMAYGEAIYHAKTPVYDDDILIG